MTVPFAHVPANLRTPLFYAEVDASNANNAQQPQRALLIGGLTSAGDATAGKPIPIQSVAHAKQKFGAGSHLALMVDVYRTNDPVGELWCLPLADHGSGVAATASFTFTNVATAAGTLTKYIAGQRVQMAVTASQTLAQLATAWAAAVNAALDLPVTAAVDGSDTTKVNYTAKNDGTPGNDIRLVVNFLDHAGGEDTPPGLTFTGATTMSSGATNPVLDTALANCLDLPFDFIAIAWNDTTTLNAMKSFLDDTSGRWSYARQVYGHFVAAYAGTLGNRTSLGSGRNDPHGTIIGFKNSPHPPFVWAAATLGAMAPSLRADPARPVQTLPILGVLAPKLEDRDSQTDQQALLFTGISTYTADADGTVRIQRLITTYQTNAFGQADDSFLDVETLYTLAFILRDLATLVTSKYGRVKIVAAGTRVLPGSGMVSVNIIKADIVARYKEHEASGLVTDSDAFAKALVVEKNAANPSRIDVLWPGTLVSGLRIFALLAQFRK